MNVTPLPINCAASVNQMAMKFVLDSKRSSSGKVLGGSVPEVRIAQWEAEVNCCTRISLERAIQNVMHPEKR